MKNESTAKPKLVETYSLLTRINYGVVEEERRSIDGNPITFYVYQMVELNNSNINYDELVNILITDKYPTSEQINILTSDNSTGKTELADWVAYCKNVAREVLGIPLSLDSVKEEVLANIDNYDNSDAVNSFTFRSQQMWINKATRVGLVNAANAAKAIGDVNITVGIDGMSVTVSCDALLSMLYQIEMYALQCYNVTLTHKENVKALLSIDDVKSYDYTIGYPDKLVFEL